MNSLNIVADQNMRGVEEYFEGLGTVQLVDGRALCADQLKAADVLLVRSVTPVNAALLRGSPIRFVGTATSGFDHIDRDYLRQANIGFSHAPGSNANSVVEYVLAALCVVENKLERLLTGDKLGIIGFGNVGRALAERCLALGIDYRVYDPWLAPAEIAHAGSLAEVLACEVISIHAELTHAAPWPSIGLLGAEQLNLMVPGALLINVARGEIVDNAALLKLRRLGQGPLSVLDVWQGEPEISAELLELVEIGTAHIAGYSFDGKIRATRLLSAAVQQYFALEADTRELLEAAPSLTVPRDLQGTELLRWAIAARYPIMEDDRLLRTATKLDSGAERSQAFDQLRKHYGRRRELANSNATISSGTGQAALLRALGAIVTEV